MNQPTGPGQQYQEKLMAKCAAGEHDVKRKYGPRGIMWGVCCFPCGMRQLEADSELRCMRCGERVGG
ncbi:hypothetical protein BD413DRAFT_615173 [Trametes elegans]|nr:hypothetical protein BD413DRAFT_615173 [Trametes elegans]